MSMQQSEARQATAGDRTELDAPPPSNGALHRGSKKHDARARRSAAAARLAEEVAEARALGVAVVTKLTVDRMWNAEEDAVVCALYPDAKRAHERLPHRSVEAIRHRAASLGLVLPVKAWTSVEVATLRRLWLKVSSVELAAALPRWPLRAINRKARDTGLKPPGRPPLKLTGDPLCDAIRDRCRVLGYSMSYLDRIARTGAYFQEADWNGVRGHRLSPMVRAVHALGGDLRVEWPD